MSHQIQIRLLAYLSTALALVVIILGIALSFSKNKNNTLISSNAAQEVLVKDQVKQILDLNTDLKELRSENSALKGVISDLKDVFDGVYSNMAFDDSPYKFNSSNVVMRKNYKQIYSDKEYIGALENAYYELYSISGDAIVEDVTNYYGDMYDIPPFVLRAQIEAESGHDPLARSWSGDVGIAQLNSQYVDYFGDNYNAHVPAYKDGIKYKFSPFSVVSSIASQAYILHDIRDQLKDLDMYHEDTWLTDMLAAYNMGLTRYVQSQKNPAINRITPIYLKRIKNILRAGRITTGYSIYSLHNKGGE